ncbi:heme oxygenase-like protein [Annulohypoxylon stygium]|nr:heme oxygenase-like protein [Annulohypoxylon stygium]
MPSATQDVGATPESPRLGESINIATRPVHTRLNKLIVLRLRLALPPHADDASNYVQGLLHITPIYISFESLWQEILSTSLTDSPPNPSSKVPSRIRAILNATHLPELERSACLSADLSRITGWSEADLRTRLQDTSRESPVLAAFLARIHRTVKAKSHVLLAYAWVLYMALFAGGRFIRAALERVEPGDRFWGPLYEDGDEPVSPTALEDEEKVVFVGRGMVGRKYTMPGSFPGDEDLDDGEVGYVAVGKEKEEEEPLHPLSFFRFDTPDDGQDLRQEFKSRVEEATDVLLPEEIEEVVNEAKDIFEQMVGLVGELDDVCGTEYEAATAA